jgi:hypothetical protein
MPPDKRRAQIIVAAPQPFAQHQHGTVSTQDGADAADVTRLLVHHYFKATAGAARAPRKRSESRTQGAGASLEDHFGERLTTA